jgi:hypothetical protein
MEIAKPLMLFVAVEREKLGLPGARYLTMADGNLENLFLTCSEV